MSARETVAAWDAAAARPDAQALIHPTGTDPDGYRASGIAQAARLVQLSGRSSMDGSVRAFDFGCGDGRVLLELPVCWNLWGCDASEKMLDRLIARADALGFDRPLSGLWDGIEASWVLDAQSRIGFDLVYALAVLIHHHPDDGLQIARNLARLLAPAGTLVLNIPIRDRAADGGGWINVSTWSHHQLHALVVETGLTAEIDPAADLVILRR